MTDRSSHAARTARLTLCGLLFAAFWHPALAQSLPESTFTETVDVDLVNIEVWVTDENGEPVTGLGREAFRLFHDGAAVPISHFSQIRDRVPVKALPAGDLATQSSASQAHLVVVFDLLRLTPGTQKRFARDLQELLTDGPIPPEQVLILRLERSLSIELPFGSTADDLGNALKRFEKRGASTVSLAADLKQAVRAMQDLWTDLSSPATASSIRTRVNLITGPAASQGSAAAATGGEGESSGSGGPPTGLACDDFVDRVEPIVVSWAEREHEATSTSLSRLGDATAFLSGLEGPKTLLYLSDGLGTAPGVSATSFVRGLCPAFQTDLEVDALPQEMSPSFLKLTRRVNANRITVHAIQGSGLEGTLGGTAGRASFDRRGIHSFEKSHAANGRQGLALLAEETGGRVVAGSTPLDHELTRIANEMGSYYSLAYTPPAGGVGDHQIQLSLSDQSLQARYRRSYSDKTPDQWLIERLESALYLGLVANPLGIRLAAGQITPKTENQHILPLHIMVPVDQLTFSTGNGQPLSQLMIKVMALNTASRTLVITDRNMYLPRPGEGAGETVDLRVDLELEGGTQMIAVGVRDQASGEASVVSTTIQVGPQQPVAEVETVALPALG
jgi:VWFA-related protein